MFVKEGGHWRGIKQVMAKHNGVWKPTIPWVKQNGKWYKLSTGKYIYIGNQDQLIQFDEDFNKLWSIIVPDLKITAITEDYEGNIVVGTYSDRAGWYAASIVKYSSNGQKIWSKSTESGVNALDIDKNNNIYIAVRAKPIEKYSPTGNLIQRIDVGETYNLLISDNHLYSASSMNQYVTVWKHDLEGNQIWSKEDRMWSWGVNALEIDTEQNLYLGSGSELYKIPENSSIHSWSRDFSSFIHNIKTDEGLLFVTTIYDSPAKPKGIYCLKASDNTTIWSDTKQGNISNIELDKDNQLIYAIRNTKLIIYDYQGSIIKEDDNYQGDIIYLGED